MVENDQNFLTPETKLGKQPDTDFTDLVGQIRLASPSFEGLPEEEGVAKTKENIQNCIDDLLELEVPRKLVYETISKWVAGLMGTEDPKADRQS